MIDILIFAVFDVLYNTHELLNYSEFLTLKIAVFKLD